MRTAGVVFIVMVLFFFGLDFIYVKGTSAVVEDTFKSYSRVDSVSSSTDSNSGSYVHHEAKWLLIFKNEVFEDSDNYICLKFNSSSLLSDLDAGKKYQLHVYGLRIPFLSTYRNVVSVKEIN
jgi:hypothetical protein